jgi:hypothetical protein
MLIEASWPIEDAQKEIEQIQARQFEQARALADATGDTQLVADFLGVDITAGTDPAPTPTLPPTAADTTLAGTALDGQQGSGGNTA